MHRHTALRGVDQRVCDAAAGATFVVKDVGGQPDLVLRCGDGAAHRREERVTALQQAHLVAADVARRGRQGQDVAVVAVHDKSSSATSGRWSDIRAQLIPRGTMVERQSRPRR